MSPRVLEMPARFHATGPAYGGRAEEAVRAVHED